MFRQMPCQVVSPTKVSHIMSPSQTKPLPPLPQIDRATGRIVEAGVPLPLPPSTRPQGTGTLEPPGTLKPLVKPLPSPLLQGGLHAAAALAPTAQW